MRKALNNYPFFISDLIIRFREDYGLLAKGLVAKVSHEKRKGYFSLAKNHAKDEVILKKMIPEFKKHGIEVDLEINEINRIKELDKKSWGKNHA